MADYLSNCFGRLTVNDAPDVNDAPGADDEIPKVRLFAGAPDNSDVNLNVSKHITCRVNT